jgi:hypothetical protein
MIFTGSATLLFPLQHKHANSGVHTVSSSVDKWISLILVKSETLILLGQSLCLDTLLIYLLDLLGLKFCVL